MTKLKIILQYKYLFIIILIFSLGYAFIRINIGYKSVITPTNYYEGVITDIKYDNSKYTLKVHDQETIICYYKSDIASLFNLGDKVLIKGSMSEPNANTIFNNFNYKKYLYNNHIYYIMNADEIKVLSRTKNIIYQIKNFIIKRCQSLKNAGYIKAFIIGDKSDLDEYQIFKANGISHLFALSGMHITILSTIFLFLFKRFKKVNYIVLILLIFYTLLTNISSSLLRSVLFYILNLLNKELNLNIKIKDLLLLTISILIIYNPLIIYDIGFLYSALVTYGLIICLKYYQKNYLYNLLITSIIAFLFSMPITIYNNYEINMLSIISNMIIVPIISLIIYPLSLIVFIFPFIEPILSIFIYALNGINNLLSNYSLFIIIPKVNIIFYFIYYLILLLFINSNNYKYLICALLFIFSFKLKPLVNQNLSVYFLDVGQGDSTLITYKNNAYLIDTGGSFNYHVSDKIIIFTKSLGYNQLSIILSHGDFDHMGETENIVNNFKVENVIFNCGTYNDLEQELIKVLDKKKIKYYSCIKELNIDKYKLEFLNMKEYDNENDNSNVVYFNYDGYKFLFMGDAGIEKEKDILDKYNLKDIDFLKVGHHGSNTSSSGYFIDKINPKYSLISVGKNNRYGHPKDEVLETLRNSKIYRTDIDGSIEIKLNKNGYKIRTCPP